MNKKILIPVIFGIAISIILITILIPMNQKPITITEKPINEKPVNEPIPTRDDQIPLNDTTIPTNNTVVPITPIDFSYVDSNSLMKSSLAAKGISCLVH